MRNIIQGRSKKIKKQYIYLMTFYKIVYDSVVEEKIIFQTSEMLTNF